MSARILTIGYGARRLEDFLGALATFGVRYLIDVRSYPKSKFRPEFDSDALVAPLRTLPCRYVFMGDTLGGRPNDESCYTDGHVDYAKCKLNSTYRLGLERLLRAADLGLPIALMCSEGRPADCHRAKLIGEMLVEVGLDVAHIDERGHEASHTAVITSLLGRQPSLLGEEPKFYSRNKYRSGAAGDGSDR